MVIKAHDIDRFWANVDKCGPDGCWIWTGSRNHQGGRFWIEGKHWAAKCVAYAIHNQTEFPSEVFLTWAILHVLTRNT